MKRIPRMSPKYLTYKEARGACHGLLWRRCWNLACVEFDDQLLFAGHGDLGALGAADQASLEVVRVFGGGAATYGLLNAAPGAGALLGALTTGWVSHVRRQGMAVLVSVALWGAAVVGFGLTPWLWLALVLVASPVLPVDPVLPESPELTCVAHSASTHNP